MTRKARPRSGLGISAAILMVMSGDALAQSQPVQIESEYKDSWAEYLAMKAHAQPPKITSWAGIWRRAPGAGGIGSFGNQDGPRPGMQGYGLSSAELTPKYRAAWDKKVENARKGIEWDRLSYCLPVGMPRWLTEPWMREFIVTPDLTLLIHEQISEVRRVYTDGKGHTRPGEVGPLWEGESIGFWDGDTLVIHTTHLKAGEYQRGLPDYSFKTSTLERMRLIQPDVIEDQIVVYDPASLLKPYRATFTYKKVQDPTVRINFGSCEEGNNAVRTPDGSTTFILPGEPGYRDPTTLGIPDVALDSLPQ